MTLHLLSAGAAQGLVRAIEPAFAAESGVALSAHFGAVGAMQQRFDAGEPCDVIVLTAALIEALASQPQKEFTFTAVAGQPYWFDYVSDIADGWNPTFAIADGISRRELTVLDAGCCGMAG